MKARRLPGAVLALACLSPVIAGAEIFRCVSAGAVTYQEVPCPQASTTQVVAIPTEFPPVNAAERNRLFEREAALDRRLEARRDRELQETLARAAREERESDRLRIAALEAQQSQYALVYPLPYWRPSSPRRPHNAAMLQGRGSQSIFR